MVTHECPTCGYTTENIVDLRRHQSRKRPCTGAMPDTLPVLPPTEVHKCPTCYRSFVQQRSLQRHLHTGCDHKPSPFSCSVCQQDCKTRNGLYFHRKHDKCNERQPSHEIVSRFESLEEHIRTLQTELGKLNRGPSTVITNNHHHITHNTQNTQNNIILNFDIGSGTQYDTSHMTPQKVSKILHKFRPELLPQASHHFLQLIYSNPANRNILKNSFYSKICDVFMDHEWRSMPEVEVLKMLTYDVFSAVLETYEQMDKPKRSEEHAEILNLIVSEEEPYEPKACEAMRAALVDVTKKYHVAPRGKAT